jgi:hypothetical protein
MDDAVKNLLTYEGLYIMMLKIVVISEVLKMVFPVDISYEKVFDVASRLKPS